MTDPNQGHRLGYTRVSSEDQNTVRQLEGLSFDKVFTDKVSGGNANRPQLTPLLGHAREGDTVVVHSMDRLARNLDDLRSLVNQLNSRGVRVEFVKEGLTFTGEDSAMSKLLLNVMGAFAEFERALIRERQREGITAAKKAGVYKGRKKTLSAIQVNDLRQRSALLEESPRPASPGTSGSAAKRSTSTSSPYLLSDVSKLVHVSSQLQGGWPRQGVASQRDRPL